MPSAAVNHSEAAVVSPRTVKLEDDAGAEKADARHDALRHAARVGAEIVVGSEAEPTCLIDRDEHEHRRPEADKRVRSEARGASVEAPLKTDQPAC
jgi:hypothetical protein